MQDDDILHIVSAEVVGDHRLHIEFDDHTQKTVDLMPLLDGHVLEPLCDPKYFASVVVDAIVGMVVWPKGADFALEALYGLPNGLIEERTS